MIGLGRPNLEQLRQRLAASPAQFTYEEVGATRTRERPRSFAIDQASYQLGEGRELFERGVVALKTWRMYPTEFAQLLRLPRTDELGLAVQVDEVVASLFQFGPVYFFTPCRVVYVEETPCSFAFAFGSVDDHVECGEERFEIRIDDDTQRVSYEFYVISKPGHWLVRLGYYYTRNLQQRFRDMSAAQLREHLDV